MSFEIGDLGKVNKPYQGKESDDCEFQKGQLLNIISFPDKENIVRASPVDKPEKKRTHPGVSSDKDHRKGKGQALERREERAAEEGKGRQAQGRKGTQRTAKERKRRKDQRRKGAQGREKKETDRRRPKVSRDFIFKVLQLFVRKIKRH